MHCCKEPRSILKCLPGTLGKKMVLVFWKSNNLDRLSLAEIGDVTRFDVQRQDSWAKCVQHSDVEKVL